jgi:hypothetical protein
MPRIVIMMDGIVIKEVELTKERTSLGRRPYNDIVIENLAVSGEHAAFYVTSHEVAIEDLNSTNGTFVNGKAIRKQVLRHGDEMEVGKYKLQFESEQEPDFEETQMVSRRKPAIAEDSMPKRPVTGSIKVLSGPANGREMALTKVVTTVGKPGVSIAAVTHRGHYFSIHCVEGPDIPVLNGAAISSEPVILKNGDHMVLAGTHMQFIQT